MGSTWKKANLIKWQLCNKSCANWNTTRWPLFPSQIFADCNTSYASWYCSEFNRFIFLSSTLFGSAKITHIFLQYDISLFSSHIELMLAIQSCVVECTHNHITDIKSDTTIECFIQFLANIKFKQHIAAPISHRNIQLHWFMTTCNFGVLQTAMWWHRLLQ